MYVITDLSVFLILVLMERKDALASNFVKLRKEKFKKMGDSLAKSKGRLAQSKK